MDKVVQQAMAKWPNVPHCYGWLALDARGQWRMRDEHAQNNDLAGERLMHPALIAFIQRNYDCDARGCWYFQNGPQRVFVNLAATPFIARLDGAGAYVLHDGSAAGEACAAYMTEAGALILDFNGRIAQLEDRDMAQVLPKLRLDGGPPEEDALMAWMTDVGHGVQPPAMHLMTREGSVAVEGISSASLPQRFGFVQRPLAA